MTSLSEVADAFHRPSVLIERTVYLIATFWYTLMAYQVSLIEPWFVYP